MRAIWDCVVFPRALSIDYFHDVVPLIDSPASVAFVVSLLVVAVFAALAPCSSRGGYPVGLLRIVRREPAPTHWSRRSHLRLRS